MRTKKSKAQRDLEYFQRRLVCFGDGDRQLVFRTNKTSLQLDFSAWPICDLTFKFDLKAAKALADWFEEEFENLPDDLEDTTSSAPENPEPLVLICKKGVFNLSRDGYSYTLVLELPEDPKHPDFDRFLMDYQLTPMCCARLNRQLYCAYGEDEEV